MAMDAAQRLSGQFVNAESLEPMAEHGGCHVEFYMAAAPDQLLTEGGEINRRHPRVKEIRKLESEALALLRSQEPFTEEEPQPPAKDAPPPVQRKFEEAHKAWDDRRLAHDATLVERSTLLHEHHEIKDLLVVSPAGRPIYVEREYIRIVTPGDKDNIPERPVREDDRLAYPELYAKFKAGQTQAATGTPLEQWPGVNRAQVKELAYFNIRTVEQLAALSDGNMSNIGPYTALRRKAQDWLKVARGASPVEEARAEAKRAHEEIAELKRQMAALMEQGNQRQGKRP